MREPPDDLDRGLLLLTSAILRGTPATPDLRLDPDRLRRHLIAPLAFTAGRVELRSDYINAALHAERRAAYLSELARHLAGIPLMRLKGIAYIETIYDDAALRPMTDIDLLVPPDRFDEACARLRAAGYGDDGKRNQRSPANHAVTFRRKENAVDLHRSMMQAGRLSVAATSVWQAPRPLPDGTYLPAPETQYLLHLAHMARHEFSVPLISLIDADRLLRGLTSPPDAASWGLARAHELLGRYLDAFRGARMMELLTFPGTLELVRGELPPRWLQIIRKFAIHDDLRGALRLGTASIRTRLGV